jgi:hypothetical protein
MSSRSSPASISWRCKPIDRSRRNSKRTRKRRERKKTKSAKKKKRGSARSKKRPHSLRRRRQRLLAKSKLRPRKPRVTNTTRRSNSRRLLSHTLKLSSLMRMNFCTTLTALLYTSR